jgi:hypothetical protein
MLSHQNTSHLAGALAIIESARDVAKAARRHVRRDA